MAEQWEPLVTVAARRDLGTIASPGPASSRLELVRDRFGRWVRVTEERLEHIREHPEMRGIEPLLSVALGDPARVVASLSDPWVWLYYRQIAHPSLHAKLLCVAVKGGWRDAFVLTAYLTNREKRGRRIWPLDV